MRWLTSVGWRADRAAAQRNARRAGIHPRAPAGPGPADPGRHLGDPPGPALDPGPPARPARPPASPVPDPYITLNEIGAETAAWKLNLNGADFDATPGDRDPEGGHGGGLGLGEHDPHTHPMHVHLVTFQVVGRTPYDVAAYQKKYGGPGVPGGISPEPYATGPMQPPTPDERGFKDTVKANPGFFTTIRPEWESPRGVTAPQKSTRHHCHIVEHEDNDQMRPFTVTP